MRSEEYARLKDDSFVSLLLRNHTCEVARRGRSSTTDTVAVNCVGRIKFFSHALAGFA